MNRTSQDTRGASLAGPGDVPRGTGVRHGMREPGTATRRRHRRGHSDQRGCEDISGQLATQDMQAVRTAAADRRLYLPTRLIPARNTSPHPYTAAPRKRVDTLLTNYDHAVSACASATAALDTVALAIEAPSGVLTISRRLAAADQDHQRHAQDQRYASQRAAAWPSRIEQAPLNHETSDPDLLDRAAIGEAPRASPPKR